MCAGGGGGGVCGFVGVCAMGPEGGGSIVRRLQGPDVRVFSFGFGPDKFKLAGLSFQGLAVILPSFTSEDVNLHSCTSKLVLYME